MAQFSLATLNEYAGNVENTTFSEKKAKSMFLNWLKAINLQKGFLFVFDENGIVISHPNSESIGTSIGSLEDIKGRLISNVMRSDLLNLNGESAVFFWNDPRTNAKEKKLGFFIPFRKWHWTICAALDFEEIEAENERKLHNILTVLKKTFKKIQISKDGYAFLFDGSGEIFIDSQRENLGKFFTKTNDKTGNTLLNDLIKASADKAKPIRYLEPTAKGIEEIEAHVGYFKPFDWYIGLAVPVSEIQKPAKSLITHQSMVIALIFLGSLVIAFFLVAEISRPLNKLTSIVENLSLNDFVDMPEEKLSTNDIIIKSKDEVGRLAESFYVMRTELKSNIRKLIETRASESKARFKKEAAEAANHAKSRILANMSHEIRTPMNAIVNFCNLLTRTELSQKQKEYLSIIHSSSKTLLEIINDILDLSKIEAGKLEIEKFPTSIHRVIEEVSNLFCHLANKKKINYEVTISPDVPDQVITDPLRLKQVLINLVSNAFKFTEKGRIAISVNAESVNRDNVNLIFCIEDTGIGIAAEFQGQLFEAFTQADSSITRKYGGTGLGLTISKKIVDLMDGRIWVESSPNVGSSFFIALNLSLATKKNIRSKCVYPALKNLKILIVSADPRLTQMIRKTFETCCDHIQTASSAEAALSMHQNSLEGNPFDLFIMDIRQPGMDGLTASKKLKNLKSDKVPAIILFNFSGRRNDILTIHEAGIDAYLMKPFSQSLLFDAILNIFVKETSKDIPGLTEAFVPVEFSGGHILLVEDNPVNQLVAVEVLKSAGLAVDEVFNGIEAVEAVKRKKYDAVLMDIQMPLMDGLEATRMIRKNLDTVDLPIIAMTAHAMNGDKEKFLGAGMNGYVAKPIDCEQLFAVLKHYIPAAKTPEPKQSEKAKLISKMNSKLFGLSVEDGINRVGSFEKYMTFLNDFYYQNKSFQADLRQLVSSKNYEAAKLKAHSLKGAAGNVSAESIRAAAENLELSCQSEEQEQILIELKSIEGCFAELKNFLVKMKQCNPDRQSMRAEEASVDIVQVFKIAKNLDNRLVECDPLGSKRYFMKISHYLFANGLKTNSETFEKQIENYQFDDARKTLRLIVEKLEKLNTCKQN
jgi:signal transduction histidine kinase/DNA-binding response OmpR family regulator